MRINKAITTLTVAVSLTPSTTVLLNNINSNTNSNVVEASTYDNLTQAKYEVFDELNNLRKQNNLDALTWDNSLAYTAQQRAEELAKAQKLDNHRGFYTTYKYSHEQENLSQIYSVDESNPRNLAVENIKGLYIDKGHPDLGHRKAMLDPYVIKGGIGVAKSNDGGIILVQHLGVEQDEYEAKGYDYDQVLKYSNFCKNTSDLGNSRYDVVEGPSNESELNTDDVYNEVQGALSFNNNVATVRVSRAQVYEFKNNKIIKVPGKKLMQGTPWYTDQQKTVNGVVYTRVATNEWLDTRDC